MVDWDPQLDGDLRSEFDRVLRAELTADEHTMLDGLTVTPRFDVIVERGVRRLQLTFYGGSTWTEWDGTREDAHEIVRGQAASAAGSLSADHWQQHGGWRASPYAGSAGEPDTEPPPST